MGADRPCEPVAHARSEEVAAVARRCQALVEYDNTYIYILYIDVFPRECRDTCMPLSPSNRPLTPLPFPAASPLEQALVIDAKAYGNVARFMNHSCDGNVTKHVRMK